MNEPGSLDLGDRIEILDLYARQSHLIDGGEADGWAETFTVDGVFESPTFALTAVGRQALRDFAEESNNAALARGDQLRHWVDAVVIRPAGTDRADVTAYLMILATSQSGTRVDRSLRIIDRVVKVDGAWLFSSRTVVRDGPLPGAPSPPAPSPDTDRGSA